MKYLLAGFGAVIVLLLLLIASFFLASESDEVVTLQLPNGTKTRIWVVDYDGYAWIRRGNGNTGWMAELDAATPVTVIRHGNAATYLPVKVADGPDRDRINDLTLAKYGFAERYLRLLMIDPGAAMAARLEPVSNLP